MILIIVRPMYIINIFTGLCKVSDLTNNSIISIRTQQSAWMPVAYPQVAAAH